jgi:hypothetical protein
MLLHPDQPAAVDVRLLGQQLLLLLLNGCCH